MLDKPVDNKALLALYGIELKRECNSHVILRLKDKDTDSRMSRKLYDKLISAIRESTVHDIKLPRITFGIEFEFIGEDQDDNYADFTIALARLGIWNDFVYSYKYYHNEGREWVLGRDGSIKWNTLDLIPPRTKNVIINPVGYELSTPKLVLYNDDHVSLLCDILDAAKTHLKGTVNHTCGTHVHIGFPLDGIYKEHVQYMLAWYSQMEKQVFDPIVPITRRNNLYCKKTTTDLTNKYQKLNSRYSQFNTSQKCDHIRFESRQLEGTLDIDTVIYWAKLQANIIYDLLSNIDNDNAYCSRLMQMNIFDILFNYDFDSSMISFFIDRVIKFKSKSIQTSSDCIINDYALV